MPGGRPYVFVDPDVRTEYRRLYMTLYQRVRRARQRGKTGRYAHVKNRTKIETPIVVRCCELLMERLYRRQQDDR